MTKILSRIRPLFGPTLMLAALWLFFSAVYHMGVAHAAAAAGDPTTLSSATIDTGWNMIATYGWTWGGMAIVFMTASWLLKKNESEHWIAQGKTLAYLVGAVGIGVTVVQAKMTGSPWSGVAMTVLVALFKLINPTSPSSSTPAVAAAKAVSAALAVVLLAGTVQIACGGAQGKALGSALWNCTAPERADAVAAVTPLMVSVLKAATSADGKLIDYSTVKAATSKANLMTEAGVLLSCAAASAFAILTAPQPTVPGSAASALFVIDPAALRSTWARLKAEQLGDAKFTTSAGAM